MQLAPIATKVVSSNPANGEVYSIHHYGIKCVSDLRQVGGFHRVLWFPPTNKTDCLNRTEILLKVAFNIITIKICRNEEVIKQPVQRHLTTTRKGWRVWVGKNIYPAIGLFFVIINGFK